MEKRANGFSVFSVFDEITINRIGKKVIVKNPRTQEFQESDSVESNLLFEILKVLKKK